MPLAAVLVEPEIPVDDTISDVAPVPDLGFGEFVKDWLWLPEEIVEDATDDDSDVVIGEPVELAAELLTGSEPLEAALLLMLGVTLEEATADDADDVTDEPLGLLAGNEPLETAPLLELGELLGTVLEAGAEDDSDVVTGDPVELRGVLLTGIDPLEATLLLELDDAVLEADGLDDTSGTYDVYGGKVKVGGAEEVEPEFVTGEYSVLLELPGAELLEPEEAGTLLLMADEPGSELLTVDDIAALLLSADELGNELLGPLDAEWLLGKGVIVTVL